MHRLTDQLHEIPEAGADDAAWERFVDELIGLALRNRRIMQVHFRNQDAIQQLHDRESRDNHGEAGNGLEVRLMALMVDPTVPTEARIRRLATLGSVAGAMLGSSMLGDVTDETLESTIRCIAHRVLRGGTTPTEG